LPSHQRGRQTREQPEGQASDHGADRASQSAHGQRNEAVERQDQANREVGVRQLARRKAREGADAASQGIGECADAIGRDAARTRGKSVLRHRYEDLAEHGLADEQFHPGRDDK
jgi:hypothetical protein